MFERFDQDARAAIAKAREEAARAGSREIRTEHLLLGLMDKPGDATDVLEAVQADPEEVRAAVPQVEAARLAAADTAAAPEAAADTTAADTTTADTAAADTAPVPEAGLPPEVTLAAEARPGEPVPHGPGAPQDLRLTRNARRALDLALRTAHRFRHDHVSSGHLLLSIIEQPDSGAVEALKVAGIHVGTLRTDILRQLTEAPAPPAPRRPSPVPPVQEQFAPGQD
jgi:ATP-dependent Clp protease ATP-binding subunit ClpA